MYTNLSFTAFRCEVEGCGRHFSVVSNLRRHRKVHGGTSGAGSVVGENESLHSEDDIAEGAEDEIEMED